MRDSRDPVLGAGGVAVVLRGQAFDVDFGMMPRELAKPASSLHLAGRGVETDV